MVALDIVGEAEAGVVEVEAGVVEPDVAFELADDPRISNSENVTGNGQPPPDDAEPEPAAPPFEVDDNDTEPTPWTRPSATIVAATADCVAAQPEI